MKLRLFTWIITLFMLTVNGFAETHHQSESAPVKKILFIGDSMTGWLAERLNAYGNVNGFEVATVVWDGSSLKKWGSTKRLGSIIKEQAPDAVFISLGMNELFEANPEKNLIAPFDNIMAAIGDRPVLWVGPPSWPGQDKGAVLNNWLEKELGEGRYFKSSGLNLPRQSSTNPHPTREGMIKWMDAVVEWIPDHALVKLPDVKKPTGSQMSRGNYFLYKRMKEQL